MRMPRELRVPWYRLLVESTYDTDLDNVMTTGIYNATNTASEMWTSPRPDATNTAFDGWICPRPAKPVDVADRIADLMMTESSRVNKKHKPQIKPMSLDELLFPNNTLGGSNNND